MSARTRIKRKDANHDEIVKALLKAGATVQSLAGIGGGCPDVLVGYRGRNYLMEFKVPGKKLRPDQDAWSNAWNGDKPYIVVSDTSALGVILT